MRPKVVITGMGVVSALGIGQRQNGDALKNGTTGIREARYLPTELCEFPVGEVDKSNEELLKCLSLPSGMLFSRTELLGIAALREALESAKLLDYRGLALISGTTVGGMDVTERHFPNPVPDLVRDVHDCGACTNNIADCFDCFDYTSTVSTACSSALNALINGKLLIESGERDIVVAGGSEALSRFHFHGFKSLMILDRQCCCPFDQERAGLNLGEGAAYLVLEREESALSRGAEILGVLSGAGNACDAFHQTATSDDGEGAYRAMTQALNDAGLSPENIGYVNAHGTGTPNNDATESAALRRVFVEKLPLVSSTKCYTGHTTSASGSIEATFCLMALRDRFVPAQFNYKHLDEQCITPVSKSVTLDNNLSHVMCNAFGFGGNDSSVILSRYE